VEIEKIKNFKLFKENAEIDKLLASIGGHKQNLLSETEKLQKMVTSLQVQCEHSDEEKVYVKDKGYRVRGVHDTHYGMKVLVSKICKDCGLETKRPEGSTYTICHSCWGPMKHAQTIPGQGSREFIYECTKCGHATSHT